MPVLSVKNLSITLKDICLVNDISFDINKGEILALVGESGSGKTLTALSIMDLLPKELSATQFDKQTLKRGKQIGMIFQEPMTSLNPLHTINRQIGEVIKIHNPDYSNTKLNSKIAELLDAVGLSYLNERPKSYPHQLSGGERQRIMIAIAIANDPELLIADEPTTALDVTVQAQILALLKSLQTKSGMSILLITHNLKVVERIADRVAIMTHGKIVEAGKTKNIFTAPQNTYTKNLLSAVPKTLTRPVNDNALVVMECKNVSVSYSNAASFFSWKKTSQTIIKDLSLKLRQGNTLGIVGESGSGKTTLALALLRLIDSQGEIYFNNERIDNVGGEALRRKRHDMQIVFQDPFSSLNPRMIIGDIIREGLDVHEATLSIEEREKRVDDILVEVGLLPQMKQRYPHEFSGGQRQRISIARALILKPKLIVLDEPTSALDITVQAQILDLLNNLQSKYNLSYIFISHDLKTIRAVSHNIMVLRRGQLVESGSKEEIFNHPKNDYTRALLAAAI